MLELVSGETSWTLPTVTVVLIFSIVTLGFLWLARRLFRKMVEEEENLYVTVTDFRGRQRLRKEDVLSYIAGNRNSQEIMRQQAYNKEAQAAKAERAIAVARPLFNLDYELLLDILMHHYSRGDRVAEIKRRYDNLSERELEHALELVELINDFACGLGALVALHGAKQEAMTERLSRSFPTVRREKLWQIVSHFARLEG